MLSDFHDFVPDANDDPVDDVEAVARANYRPFVQSPCWFLNKATSEQPLDQTSFDICRFKAAHFCRLRRFQEAFDLYIRLLNESGCRAQFLIELLDAAIRCGLNCRQNAICARLLTEYEETAKTPDQRFQFLHLAKSTYRTWNDKEKWQNTLILLISDNEQNAHYWLELADTGGLDAKDSNLWIGCTVRAVELLKRTAHTDMGFAKETRIDLVNRLKNALADVDVERVNMARQNMCCDLAHYGQLDDESKPFSYRGDTESNIDSGLVLSNSQQFHFVVAQFRKRFSWLFLE